MEKEISTDLGGDGMLPPLAHFSGFSSEGTTFGVRGETSRSTAPYPISAMSQLLGQFRQAFSFGSELFSHDLGQMMDVPQMINIGHQRAQSDPLGLPNKFRFVSGPNTVGAFDGSTSSEENMSENDEDLISMYMDMDKLNSSFGLYGFEGGEEPAEVTPQVPSSNKNVWESPSEKPIVRHQQSLSLDGSNMVQHKLLILGAEWTAAQESRKARSAAKLLEIALVDPNRAKRIWANRQSAARSKERKMRYVSDLEQKVKTLEIEVASLSTRLAMVKRDTTDFTIENEKLKVRLHSIEQQVQLQDAINNALKEEVQHLQVVAGTVSPIGGDMTNNGAGFNANQQHYPYNNALHTLITDQQLHQLQIRPPLQLNQVQHQPPNVMRNKGPTPPSQKGTDFKSSSME